MKTKNLKQNLYKAISAVFLVSGAIAVATPTLAAYYECIPDGYGPDIPFTTCRKELQRVPGSNEMRETVIGNCGSTRNPTDAYCGHTNFEASCFFSPHDLEKPIQSRRGTCRQDIITGEFSCDNEGKYTGGTKIFVKKCSTGPYDR